MLVELFNGKLVSFVEFVILSPGIIALETLDGQVIVSRFKGFRQ